MNRFIFCLILCLMTWTTGLAQSVKTVNASYTYYAPETMSVEEAKRTALDRAKIQAIADEFGTIVSQSTSTVISNKNGEPDTQFFSIGGSDVKGEWIETIGEPVYNIRFDNHFLVVDCTVKGKAREIESAKIEFVAKPLRNGTTLKYESTEFKDGDDLFLYFKSPINGNLAVYLLDETTQTVYSILPYKAEDITATPIERDKDYIFFSVKDAERGEKGKVDEYTLNCENTKEFNTLFVLFSPTDIGKKTSFKSEVEDKPNNIKYEDFKKWLSKSMTKNKLLQTTQISISIQK